MGLQKVILFSKTIRQVFDEKKSHILSSVNNHKIIHTMQLYELINIKAAVFKELWKWPNIALRELTKEDITTTVQQLSPYELKDVFGSLTISSGFVETHVVNYSIKFDGDKDALLYSGSGNEISFYGVKNNFQFDLNFYSKYNLNHENGKEKIAEIKIIRDNIISDIKQTLINNTSVIGSLEEEFKNEINSIVDSIFKKKVDENNLKNDLL